MSDSNGLNAGWFDDPAGAEALRWWDGAAWTTQLRPKQVPPASVGVGSWILPSPGNGPGTGFSPAAIAAPAQPLAITDGAGSAPQPEYYAPATPQQIPFNQAAAQPTHYAEASPQPERFVQSAPPPPAEGPTRSAQTAGVWLLALYPLFVIPIAVSAQWGADWVLVQLGLAFPGSNVIGAAVALIIGWVFAGADIGRLGRRGYRAPSILWMLLLPPVGYFIARSVALRRDRGKTWPAGIVLGISLAILAAVVVVMISVVIALLASFGLIPADFVVTLPL